MVPLQYVVLRQNGNIKITDIAETLFYETTAKVELLHGMATTLKASVHKQGVYLVFATDEKGNNTCVNKLFSGKLITDFSTWLWIFLIR